jgi:hypothetical protein
LSWNVRFNVSSVDARLPTLLRPLPNAIELRPANG